MFLRTTETAFARFQAKGEAAALAIVFDRTAPELCKVARHFARCVGDAEDLVQATFLTAIESAGSHQRGRPVLPWLLGILANHARVHRRASRRRPDPDRVRGDVTADVHDEVNDKELRRELAASIDKLPETYRPVMRLWLEHGLEAHEIAATLERPSGTVRSQVARGLDMLRRALPPSLAGGAAIAVASGRGLAAVRGHVLGQCAGASSGIASALAIGGLLMLHHKVMSAGVVLAIALVSWFVIAPPFGGDPAPGTGNEALAAESGGVDRGAEAVGAEPARREAAAAPAGVTPQPVVPIAAATMLVVILRAAGSGAPIVGYGVSLRPAAHLANLAIVPDFRPTGRDGAARFDDVEPDLYYIEVDRIGIAATVRAIEGERTSCSVEIPDAVAVEGTVVDAFDQPVAGVDIVAQGSRLAAPRLAVTDANGRFTATHVARLELQARKSGYSPSLAHMVLGGAGEKVTLKLRLGAAERRISGRFFDHEGKPVANAVVAVVADSARQLTPWDGQEPQVRPIWLSTDREGRFATDEISKGRYLVVARARELGTPPAWADADATTADAFVELRSEQPTILEGRIRREGRPVAGVRISAFPEKSAADIGYLLNLIGMRNAVTGEDGTFRIEGSIPGELALRAQQGTSALGSARRTVAAGESVRWDLDIGKGNDLEIRVETTANLPPRLIAFVYDTTRNGASPGMVSISPDGAGKHARTSAGEIEVVLAVLPGGGSVIQLAKQRVAPTEKIVRFELAAGDLPVRMLRGRLVDASQAPVAGKTVSVRRAGAAMAALAVYVTATTGADGAFEFGPLPAGDYAVMTGPMNRPKLIGKALVTIDRDEDMGAITVE